jgi:NADPH:quinone reductase-like Zn-dependent oxidoreductase
VKAILQRNYGSPDVISCEETEKPVPGDDDVLIAVRAASVNPLDYHLVRGTPYIGRLAFGLRRPKDMRLGVDVAGRVEAVGRNVTRFKPGDDVFGACRGAFAEYACAPESALCLKPRSVTFEQAACLPVAALTALQGLRDRGRIQPGQTVLINGAAGGVGHFAVQIAKHFGAETTGVCSTTAVDLVRSIGADHVIDYTREDFTTGPLRYDVMFDCVGNRSLSACRRVLNRTGIYIAIGAPTDGWIAPLPRFLTLLVLSRFVSQNLAVFIARRAADDLAILAGLVESGSITPVIDRRFKLTETSEAVRYLEARHARGKVVITTTPGETT